VLTQLNDALLKDFPRSKFVTMVYALLNPADRDRHLRKRRVMARSATSRTMLRVEAIRRAAAIPLPETSASTTAIRPSAMGM
jgi:hypothetical protein